MNEKELEQEISQLTERLREEKPTVYKHLLENPQTIPTAPDTEFIEELKAYRETLLKLLEPQ
jgi:hypothetical protein